MVHPAVKKCVQVQPASCHPNPSLKSTSCDDDKSTILSHQPTLTTSLNFKDLNSSNATSVHDLQTSLYTLLDTMTPVEFSKTLHSHIQSVLNHWPPQCDPNPLSTPVSTMNGSQETVTTASVIGLVKFFNPRTTERSRLHDQSQISLSDLYHQLHQVKISLTFLSVSELMQVFQARLKAPNEIVSMPNVLLGLCDVMRNKSIPSLTGPTSKEPSTTGTATLLATSESANSEVEDGLADSRVVSNVPASQTAKVDRDDRNDQRPCKKAKIDLESRLDGQGSSQHLKSLSMMDGGRPSYAHRGRSQELNPNHVPSNAAHPFFSPSLRKTAKYGPSPSTHTASEGRLSFTLGELAAWKGSPLMVEARRTDAPLLVSIFDENEDVQSAQLDPLPSTILEKANIPSMDDEDLCSSDITETVPGASGTPDLAQPRAFRADGHVVADPKSLSNLMKIAPRATSSSQDTFNASSPMDSPSVSSTAFMTAPSLSHVWHARCSPRG